MRPGAHLDLFTVESRLGRVLEKILETKKGTVFKFVATRGRGQNLSRTKIYPQEQLVLGYSLDWFDQIIADRHSAADLVLDLLQTDGQLFLLQDWILSSSREAFRCVQERRIVHTSPWPYSKVYVGCSYGRAGHSSVERLR